jgi:hypothetical protein
MFIHNGIKNCMFAKYFMEGFELCGHQNGKVVDEQNG